MKYSKGDRIVYNGFSGHVTSYSNTGNSVWIYLDVGIGYNVSEYMLEPEETSMTCVKYKVDLMFVSPSQEDGYTKTHLSMAETKAEAIAEAVSSNLDEIYPLSGVVVWESHVL